MTRNDLEDALTLERAGRLDEALPKHPGTPA